MITKKQKIKFRETAYHVEELTKGFYYKDNTIDTLRELSNIIFILTNDVADETRELILSKYKNK